MWRLLDVWNGRGSPSVAVGLRATRWGVGADTLSLCVPISGSLCGCGFVLSSACPARRAAVLGAAVCGGCALSGRFSASTELGPSVLAPRDGAPGVPRRDVLVARGSGCCLFGEALYRLVLLIGSSSRRRAGPRRFSCWTRSGTLVWTPSLGWMSASVEAWGSRVPVSV